jgi:hypothetical protein
MIDKIKSNLTNSYLMFVFDFGDPAECDKGALAQKIGCPIIEVFKSQRTADKAKKVLGKKGFGEMLVVYFSAFQSQDGVKFAELEREIKAHRKVFLRHLGKDKVNYLNLMISVSGSLETQKRGLLGVVA